MQGEIMWVGVSAVFNEAKFIEKSIRSIIDSVDRYIIVEGCWLNGETITKSLRSTDGTIEILERLKKEFPNKLEIIHANGENEQRHRDKYLERLDNNDMVIWIDSDEILIKSEVEEAKKYADYMINKLGHQMVFAHYINIFDEFALIDDHIRGFIYKFKSDLRHLSNERLEEGRRGEIYLFEDFGSGNLYNKSMPVIPWEILKVFHFKYCKDWDKLVERKLMYDKIWNGVTDDKIEERRNEMMQLGKAKFIPNEDRIYRGAMPI